MHITFHSFPVEHATQNTSTQGSIIGDLPQRGAPSFFCFLALCPRARRAGRQREEVLEQAAAFEANEGLTEGALPKEPGLHVMSRPGASKQAASRACGRKGRARREGNRGTEEPRNRDSGWLGRGLGYDLDTKIGVWKVCPVSFRGEWHIPAKGTSTGSVRPLPEASC